MPKRFPQKKAIRAKIGASNAGFNTLIEENIREVHLIGQRNITKLMRKYTLWPKQLLAEALHYFMSKFIHHFVGHADQPTDQSATKFHFWDRLKKNTQ
jgi:hypothetical protein